MSKNGVQDAVSSCPVDHGALHKTPTDSQSPAQCPVDHQSPSSSSSSSLSSWRAFLPFASSSSSQEVPPPTSSPESSLSKQRETSSIPNAQGERWVYPSEAQFFAAMARKQHDPQASDMRVVVPIHNAVNERAWGEILKWEKGRGGEQCGGVKLVSFKGRPGDLSPRARWKSLLGYTKPFDRHDWVVDRCGVRTRYIIDFYTGRSAGAAQGALSFYLDVRPALDSWEGVKMRMEMGWDRWFGSTERTSTPMSTSTPSS